MLPTVENLTPDPGRSFTIRRFDLDAFPFVWHVHPEYELTLIIDGRGLRFVNDGVAFFEPGDVVLLGSHVPHTWFSQPEPPRRSSSVVIQFHPVCFGPSFFDLPEMEKVAALLRRAAVGLRFIGEAARRAEAVMRAMCDMDAAEQMLTLLRTLHELAGTAEVEPLSSASRALALRGRDQSRLDRVLRHVAEHYEEEIDQPALANLAHMSPSTFSRFFRRMTGRSLTEYVLHVRITAACRLLAETDRPVSDICFACGFGNLSYFNRMFRRLKGVTPREFRSRAAEALGALPEAQRRAVPVPLEGGG